MQLKFSAADFDLNILFENEQVAMRVMDKRIGIQEDEQQHFFKQFLG